MREVNSRLFRLLPMMVVVMMGCGGEGLDGPKRSAYEGISEVEAVVEQGEVAIFGSGKISGALVDRWNDAEENFSKLEEYSQGRHLRMEASCREEGQCQVRYDVAVERTARLQVQVQKGKVKLIGVEGSVVAHVEDGRVRGDRLKSEQIDIEVQKGSVRLHFERAPSNLRLRLGEAEATVLLPDQRYRCEFDRNAERIGLNGLQCHDLVGDVIRVEPEDAKVRFEVIE